MSESVFHLCRSLELLCSAQTDVQAAYDNLVVCLERRKPI